MTLGLIEIALIGLSAVVVSLLSYWAWISLSGWLGEWRWRRHGVDRRSARAGRRKSD